MSQVEYDESLHRFVNLFLDCSRNHPNKSMRNQCLVMGIGFASMYVDILGMTAEAVCASGTDSRYTEEQRDKDKAIKQLTRSVGWNHLGGGVQK